LEIADGNSYCVESDECEVRRKLGDGDGLWLDVDKSGNASWLFRFKSPVTGKERIMGSRSHLVLCKAFPVEMTQNNFVHVFSNTVKYLFGA